MLLEFAQFYDLVLVNTLYPQKMSREATWHSPDGKTHIMIDYNIDQSTFPVKCKLQTLRKARSTKTKFSLQKLKDPDIAKKIRMKG